MNGPIVSVVMSVFNGERFLREAVDSVLGQSFREFEFIILDDGSNDASASILDSYAKVDPRVIVYHQENRGLIASLNFACKNARGYYIARMDADDIAVRDRLLWQVAFLDAHPEVGVVGGAAAVINADGIPVGKLSMPTDHTRISSALLENCVIIHPTVLMRKDILLAVGGYRNIMVDAEDYDLWLRLAEQTQLANLDDVVLKRRCHPSQVSVTGVRRQALSTIAAQLSAHFRRNGKSDPLLWVDKIRPSMLVQLGMDETSQDATLARLYIGRIRALERAGNHSAAGSLYADVVKCSRWKNADKWIVTDLLLFEARLNWREGRYATCFGSAVHAFIYRPIIIGRPVKQLVRSFLETEKRSVIAYSVAHRIGSKSVVHARKYFKRQKRES